MSAGTHAHPPNVVFTHHLPPISRLFFYTVAHPPNGGFRTPSPTHPTVVFVHHRAPISREFLYTIAHPPNGGFHTIAYPSLTAIFVHHRAPAQRWFSYTIVHPSVFYTIAHPSNGSFCTPARSHLPRWTRSPHPPVFITYQPLRRLQLPYQLLSLNPTRRASATSSQTPTSLFHC